MRLTLSDAHEAFRREVAEFARARVAPAAAGIDETGRFPRDLMKEVASRGLLGTTIPPEWGGGGRSYVEYALALEALATASPVVSVIAGVNNSLVAEPLAAFGSETQKQTWLRRLATGSSIGSFALSEPQSGSDAANQQTTARLEDRGYVLNGHKVWVANGEVADVAIVFAATQSGVGHPAPPGDGEPSQRAEGRGRAMGAFLIPLDTPGVSCVPTGESLGVRGLGCVDIELRDVRLDSSALLGGAHDGFGIAMWALDGGRVAIAAQALGVGEAALAEAIAHAKSHSAFGEPIANYEAIQWMLADSATELAAARMLMLKAADARTRSPRPTLEAAMAKLAASEAAHRAADRAMQILASHGYRRGSVVERLFRDVRATEIYQGTSEVQRMIISEFVI